MKQNLLTDGCAPAASRVAAEVAAACAALAPAVLSFCQRERGRA